MRRLSQNLMEAVRSLAYRTSVDQLKKRGIKRVNLVSMDRMAALLEEAVHRSLRHRLAGLERDEVVGATKEEFIRLLNSKQDLERSANELRRLKDRAEEEVDVLRRELAQQQEMLRRKRESLADLQAHVRFEGENAVVAEQVDEMFRDLATADRPDWTAARDATLALIMDFVDRERQRTLAAQQAARDGELERMQRRIEKLNTALQESEQRLVHMASLKSLDDGISSVYREVQGLKASEAQYKRKREMMADIFKANLALQKGATA